MLPLAPAEMLSDLQEHLVLCRELLGVVEREGQELRQPEGATHLQFIQTRKAVLPRLDQSLARLRQHRIAWQKFTPAERSRFPEINALLRRNQDLIMKIIVLDRENEQHLLRRGMLPANHLPSPQSQRPHFVAGLYQRQSPA